jgi:protein O-GlcNAc transferase
MQSNDLNTKHDDVAAALDLYRSSRLADAEAAYRAILQRHPGHPDSLYYLGRIAHRTGQPAIGVAFLNMAVATRPTDPVLRQGLADALLALGQITHAARQYEEALALDPHFVDANVSLGVVLLQQGQPDLAVAYFRRALDLSPERLDFRSNLLLALQYVPAATRSAVFEEAIARGRFAPRAPYVAPWRTVTPSLPLRVGYISADFRRHPIGYFVEPVLAEHDPAIVEAFCYANNPQSDDLTESLRSCTPHWRSIHGLPDGEVAAMIGSDQLDVLVDLSGHTAGNRLPLLTRKLAPVQATWAGYSDTTGLTTIDYFIGDRFVSPDSASEQQFFTERIVRLPDYFLCYRPRPNCPAVAPAPLLANGYVTFGCFNSLAKVNEEVVSTWAKILHGVPKSHLCLKTGVLSDSGVKQRYIGEFEKHGIEPERLQLLAGSSEWSEYASAYHQVDLALDPFPFNGGTTSLDGLWMGVPLVTLAGDRCVGRMGNGILACLHLEDELVAYTPTDYIRKSVDLARDPARLTQLRTTLRARMAVSALCDTSKFTRGLEGLYRSMWLV